MGKALDKDRRRRYDDGPAEMISNAQTHATNYPGQNGGMPEPMPLEREFWRRRDVDVLEIPLEHYVEALGREAGLDAIGASA